MLRQQLRRMSSAARTPSPHATFYRDTLPAMGPVFLIAFAVYMGLKLAQSRLAHEKFVLDTKAHIVALEQELDILRKARLQSSSPQNSSSSATGTPTSLKSWYTFWK